VVEYVGGKLVHSQAKYAVFVTAGFGVLHTVFAQVVGLRVTVCDGRHVKVFALAAGLAIAKDLL